MTSRQAKAQERYLRYYLKRYGNGVLRTLDSARREAEEALASEERSETAKGAQFKAPWALGTHTPLTAYPSKAQVTANRAKAFKALKDEDELLDKILKSKGVTR